MKNRRNIIIAFLLCATLIVSVGYATLQDILDANGSFEWFATSHAFDGDVYFTDAIAYNEHKGQSSDSAMIMENDPDKAIFSIKSLSTEKTSAFFRFEITNYNTESGYIFLRDIAKNCSATLASDLENLDPDSFLTMSYKVSKEEYDYETQSGQPFFNLNNWHTISSAESEHCHEITSNGKLYLYIAVTLDKGALKDSTDHNIELSNLSALTATFKIEFGVSNTPDGRNVHAETTTESNG